MSAASRAAKENELKILGGQLEIYNIFAREFPWSTKPKEPEPPRRRRVASDLSGKGHRRRDLTISGQLWIDPHGEGGVEDLTISGQHWIDPCGEGGVEIYDVEDSDRRRMSRPTSQDPANDKITQDFLELPSSKVSSMSPSSLKERSTDSKSTLSTTFEDLTGTSIFLKNIHNT